MGPEDGMTQTRVSRKMLVSMLALLVLSAATILPAQEASDNGVAVQGRVTDSDGAAIQGVAVVLLGTDLASVTAADGSFGLEGVPPGDYTLEARLPGYTIASLDLAVSDRPVVDLELQLIETEIPLDEIVVTASHSILREEPTSTVGLGRQEIERLPHFGDDLFRALTILPGTSGGDISAAFNVRGGFYQEVLARIDGQEVVEPFHLKDFQGVFSILDPELISGVDLIPGGYPAEYGDRMTGVLDMRTREPDEIRTNLGASFSNLWVGSAGVFADGRGSWLGSARRGFLDLVLALAEEGDEEEDEDATFRYWDAFGKVEYDLTPSQTLGLQFLTAQDTTEFEEMEDDEFFDISTSYGNSYLWATHRALIGDDAWVDTALSLGQIDGDRDAILLEEFPLEMIDVFDLRDTKVVSLRQDWGSQLGDRHLLKAGFDLRSWESSYRYRNEAELGFAINDPRFLPAERLTEFEDDFSSEQYAVYLADRVRFRRLTAEVGLRWDRMTLTDEDTISPRVNLVYDLGSSGVLRGGWGHFYQSQRPYELAVQFGETEFQDSARSEHFVLGYENLIGEHRFRLDLFRRDITDAQVRYETLFDPFNIFPEGRIDLVALPADSASADGFEVSVRSPFRTKTNWWLSYSLSSVEDEVLGETITRSIDQTHAVTASFSWRPARKWSLTWVGFFHTGWPTTPVSAEVAFPEGAEPFIDYDVGKFYSDRWDDFMRLDFRASRTTTVGKDGTLTFFIDVQNLLDRENQRGLEITDPDFDVQPGGRVDVSWGVDTWLPLLPSFGVIWEF